MINEEDEENGEDDGEDDDDEIQTRGQAIQSHPKSSPSLSLTLAL